MVDRTIFGLPLSFTDPALTDGLEMQRAGGGATGRILFQDVHKGLTKASDAEAQAGVDTEKLMTPALTAIAITALGAAGVVDHGTLDAASLLDDDHPQYLKDLIEDLTPQLGGDLDMNDKELTKGEFKNVSESFTSVTHSGGGTYTPSLAAGNNQLVAVQSNITIGKPVTTGIPGSGSRIVRMFIRLTLDGTGGYTMAFAGGWTTKAGRIPTLDNAANAVNEFEIEYDSTADDWFVVGEPVEAWDSRGAVNAAQAVDFANRKTDRMLLNIAFDINGASCSVSAVTNGPGTSEAGVVLFQIQADGTNDCTFDGTATGYHFATAKTDYSTLANGNVVTTMAIKPRGSGKWHCFEIETTGEAIF